jgi:hypothetical protein
MSTLRGSKGQLMVGRFRARKKRSQEYLFFLLFSQVGIVEKPEIREISMASDTELCCFDISEERRKEGQGKSPSRLPLLKPPRARSRSLFGSFLFPSHYGVSYSP